jgi:SH3-like domain-containing protein
MKALLIMLCLAGWALGVQAANPTDPEVPSLALSEPYVDLHTGPGRGYPVFHVAARGEVVQLLLTHTSWVKLRTANGIEGWAPRTALQGTLQAAGAVPGRWARWSDAHLRNKLEFGAAWGRFQRQPMLKLGARLRLSEAIAVQAAAGQVQGLFSGTDFWQVDTVLEPMSDLALSPVFAVGVGRFRNIPNASLVEQGTTNANLAHAGLGLRWRFAARYVLHADWSHFVALLSEQRSREYRALSVGLSFHF